MSVRLANIDLSAIVDQQVTLDTKNTQLAQCGWIEFQNESPYTIELAMGGLNLPIPAWDDYPIQLQQKSGGYWTPISAIAFPPMITPMLIANNLTQNVSTKLITTLYLTGETPSSTVPRSLARQTFVPNTVSNVSGTANAVQNDGNPSGTSVIEATVQGDGASAVSLNNDAFFSLGTVAHPARVQIVCALGTITIDSNGKVTIPDSLNANLITALAGNDLALHVPAGQRVVDTINGVDTFQVNNAGATIIAGGINYNAPAIVVNGSTSGTVTLYQDFQGNTKRVIAFLNNYRNGAAGTQTIALPRSFANGALIRTGFTGGTSDNTTFSLLSLGTPISVRLLTALAAAGGSTSTVTLIPGFSFCEAQSAFDTISFAGSGGNPHTGFLMIDGI